MFVAINGSQCHHVHLGGHSCSHQIIKSDGQFEVRWPLQYEVLATSVNPCLTISHRGVRIHSISQTNSQLCCSYPYLSRLGCLYLVIAVTTATVLAMHNSAVANLGCQQSACSQCHDGSDVALSIGSRGGYTPCSYQIQAVQLASM